MINKNGVVNTLKKLLFISTLIYPAYCCIPGGTVLKNRKFDHNNEVIFTWLVVVDDSEPDFLALAYGSLIHPKAVLTAGIDFNSKPANNYTIAKNCDLDYKDELRVSNCIIKTVSKVLRPDAQPISKNDWALLILETPFDITPTIVPINLANDLNAVDTENCLFTRWMRVEDRELQTSGLIIEPYYTKFINGEFSPKDLHPENLTDDRDWIIGEKFHLGESKTDNRIALNFLGSPLNCALKDDDQKFAQVGIATFRFSVPYDEKDHEPLYIWGSLINIIDSYDEIMTKLNENL